MSACSTIRFIFEGTCCSQPHELSRSSRRQPKITNGALSTLPAVRVRSVRACLHRRGEERRRREAFKNSSSCQVSRQYTPRKAVTCLSVVSRKEAEASSNERSGHHKGSAGAGAGGRSGKDGLHSRVQHAEVEGGAGEEEPDAPFMDAVVKVYCTHTEPNFSLPWQKRRQYSSTGSGFMIEGRRLLTNAHCVEHHTQVKVKRRGDDTKFVATVLAIGTECDIALLAVEDDQFWEGPEPLSLGALPRLQASVTVVGYPIGGDTISVTKGVVSRIEVTSYAHGSSELLGIQIDAAINAGNSGGPAFSDKGECVGIAFQSLKSPDAENIGYVIPTPVIQHFLEDFKKNECYTGFPSVGVSWQRMESPSLRACLGMGPTQKGVLIRRVEPTSHAKGLLQEGDVLIRFDSIPIANDGTVPFRAGERISFGFLVSQKFAGETATVQIIRDKREMSVQVPLRIHTRLVPVHISGRLPSFFIVAGLVFTPVVQPFLVSEYGPEFEYETPVKLLDQLLHGQADFEEQQVVVVSQVLANDVNIGYEDTTNTQVLKVNGEVVLNLRHVARLVDSCTEEYLRFDLEHSEVIILHTSDARRATREALKDHCIPGDRSADLESRDEKREEETRKVLDAPENNGAALSASPSL